METQQIVEHLTKLATRRRKVARRLATIDAAIVEVSRALVGAPAPAPEAAPVPAPAALPPPAQKPVVAPPATPAPAPKAPKREPTIVLGAGESDDAGDEMTDGLVPVPIRVTIKRSESTRSESTRTKLLAFLKGKKRVPFDAIHAHVGKSRHGLATLLSELKNAGIVTNPSRGVWEAT